MRDVDRTLLRENLKLTPAQRQEKFVKFMRLISGFRRAGRNARQYSIAGAVILCALSSVGGAETKARVTAIRKITAIENAYPDWSPDGSKIVFQSNRTGKFQIYMMTADGTHVARITDSGGADAGPHFSPDGSKIVFASDRDGNSEIYLMNADGTEEKRLTNNPADDSHPNWSPDGTRIIFNSSRDTPNSKADWWDQYHDLYSMKIDGSDLRKITNHRTVCTFGSWSPDGKKIAYRKVIKTPGFYDDAELTLSQTNSEVFVADADGKHEVNLSKSAAYDAWPVWMPDSKHIIFASNRAVRTQLYIVDVDGSHLARLIDDADSEEDARARPSRDGKRLAFTRAKHGTMEVYTCDLNQAQE
jgi:TolB protein